jgi:succinate dehydrogenase / fumarate reductase membrane anchor subunit
MAHKGAAVAHWLALRLSALLAIPLCIWLVFSIIHLAGAEYGVFRAWIRYPWHAILVMFFVLVSFYHAVLGNEEVIEDYVHQPLLKKLKLIFNSIIFSFAASICIFSVLKIIFSAG